MKEILTQAGVLVPVVIALAEVAKRMSFPTKFLPLFDMVVGAAIAILYVDTEFKFQVAIGVMAGLIACGAYSATKNTIQAVKEVK